MDKCKAIFDEAPISLWEEDYTHTKELIDDLVNQFGNDQIEHIIDTNTEILNKLVHSVKIVRVNKKTLEMFGAKNLNELRCLETVFCHESLQCFKRQMIALANNATSFEDEGINKTIDGQSLYFILKWNIHDNDYSSVLVSLIDITALKQAEEKIRTINEKYKNLIESTETAYVILNKSLEIIESNSIFEKMIGYSKDDCKNLPIWKLFSAEDPKCKNMMLNLTTISACDSNKLVESELTLIDRNNNPIWVNMVSGMFVNGLVKIFCIFRDISDKRQKELSAYITKQKHKDKLRQDINRIRNVLQELSIKNGV